MQLSILLFQVHYFLVFLIYDIEKFLSFFRKVSVIFCNDTIFIVYLFFQFLNSRFSKDGSTKNTKGKEEN